MAATVALLGTGLSSCADKETVGETSTDCAETAYENGGEGRCEKTCRVVNEEFCVERAATPDCATIPANAAVDVCGVAIKAPPEDGEAPAELERSPNVKEYAGTGPVDTSCYVSGGFPPAPTSSQAVELRGIVNIFSNGCESNNVEIEVYTVVRDGGAEDGKIDQLVGSAVITPDDCSGENGVPEPDIEGCFSDDARRECLYTYPGVPTETELVIVTKGGFWRPLYEYGVYIGNDEIQSDGGGSYHEKDIRALADDDYGTIAQAAQGKPITDGHGAVAGEVHDCDNRRVVNAVVDVNVQKFTTTYFGDDEDDPLPSLAAKATSTLGLYAALDIAPGPVSVAAAGVQNGQLIGLGFLRAWVYANAVTSCTFRGMKGYQVP
jgi:hypothetical protein